MVRGRPKGDEPTCVLAVRMPIALREELDRYLDALELPSSPSRPAAMRSSAMPCASSSEAEQHPGATKAAPARRCTMRPSRPQAGGTLQDAEGHEPVTRLPRVTTPWAVTAGG